MINRQNYSQLGTRRASGELTVIFIEFSFGNGTRSIQKDYGIPGPGAYKHQEEVSYGSLNLYQFLPPRSITKNTTYKYSPPTKIMQSNPHAYNVKDVYGGPKYSFGSKSGNMLNARRSLPAHLKRLLSSTPGPGDYEQSSSIKINRRDEGSLQNCTWQVTRQGLVDLAKNVPGPGTYDIVNTKSLESLHRSKAMEPGYKFPQGPKDAIANQIGKHYGPGPGSHSPALPKYGMGKRMLGGSLSSKELIDNGVPGPGQY